MIRIALLLVAGVALCLSPRHCADAGCHAVAIKNQAVVAYTPVYAQPYYYSVGQNLQSAASEERIASLVIQKLQNMQQLKSSETPNSSPERLPLTAEVDRWALVKKSCQSCHTTNQAAKEAVDMSDISALDCETKLRMIAACLDGTMPKSKKLDPADLGQLLGEISGAQTVEK